MTAIITSAMDELKHSVRMHMLIFGGPSTQLAVFLIKLIDVMEDQDEDRRHTETLGLAYAIVEAIAIYVQKTIDNRYMMQQKANNPLPERIKQSGDDILITMGKFRNRDKVQAKDAVLAQVALALDELGKFTKTQYPTLVSSQGRPYTR